MKALIISDIHDHVSNLESALTIAKTSECDSVIFCGDLCSPFVIDVINANCNLPVHLIFGNNDGDKFTINVKTNVVNKSRAAEKHIQLHGEFIIADKGHKLNGIPAEISLAVYHYPVMANVIAMSGNYDFVFYGHSHKSSLEAKDKCLMANPGSVMGYIPGVKGVLFKPSCLIVNWSTKEIELIEF